MTANNQTIVGELTIETPRTHLHLSVTNRRTGITNSVVVKYDRPLGVPREGERVAIGGLEGFPESRHTVGVVQKVAHTFTGGALDFIQVTTVDIDEVEF
jgi:hypothetical protein